MKKTVSIFVMLTALLLATSVFLASCAEHSDSGADSPWQDDFNRISMQIAMQTEAPKETTAAPVTTEYIYLSGEFSPNLLSYKTVTVLGTKLSAGDDSYASVLAERNKMKLKNMSAENTSVSEKNGNTPLYKLVGQMSGRSHYVLLEGSITEYLDGVQLGKITDTITDISKFDTSTYLGGLERCCYDLNLKSPDSVKLFVFTHRYADYNSEFDTKWKPEIKNTLDKWGIPYIDLQEMMPAINNIDGMRDEYTVNGEGLVPNRKCVEIFYAPRIEARLAA